MKVAAGEAKSAKTWPPCPSNANNTVPRGARGPLSGNRGKGLQVMGHRQPVFSLVFNWFRLPYKSGGHPWIRSPASLENLDVLAGWSLHCHSVATNSVWEYLRISTTPLMNPNTGAQDWLPGGTSSLPGCLCGSFPLPSPLHLCIIRKPSGAQALAQTTELEYPLCHMLASYSLKQRIRLYGHQFPTAKLKY